MTNIKWYKNILGYSYNPENKTTIPELAHLNIQNPMDTTKTYFGMTTLLALQEVALGRLNIGYDEKGYYVEWKNEAGGFQFLYLESKSVDWDLNNITEIFYTKLDSSEIEQRMVNANLRNSDPLVALAGFLLTSYYMSGNSNEVLSSFFGGMAKEITQEEFEILANDFQKYIHDQDSKEFMKLNLKYTAVPYPSLPLNEANIRRNDVSEWVMKKEENLYVFKTVRKKKTSREMIETFSEQYGLIKIEDLTDEQQLNNKILTNEMENITVPKELEALLINIKNGMRKFLFQGEAGTGKSFLTRILAAALNLSHTQELASSEKIYASDWFATLVPRTDDMDGFVSTEGVLDIDKMVEEKGGLPSLFKIKMLPKKVYKELTGIDWKNEEAPSEEELFKLYEKKQKQIYNDIISELNRGKLNPNQANQSDFVMVYTQLGKALIEGNTVIDLQEIDTMRNMDSISFLYEMLEEGWVALPNGKRVKRHPNTIICFTVNGITGGSITKELPAPFLERIEIEQKFWEMKADEMVNRIKASVVTNNEIKLSELKEMAQIVISVKNSVKKENLSGYVGYRSYQNWVKSYLATNDPYNSALMCVFNKATDEEDEFDKLVSNYLNNSQFRRKRGN